MFGVVAMGFISVYMYSHFSSGDQQHSGHRGWVVGPQPDVLGESPLDQSLIYIVAMKMGDDKNPICF